MAHLTSSRTRVLVVAALSFAAAVALFALLDRSSLGGSSGGPRAPGDGGGLRSGQSTEQRIEALQSLARASPRDADVRASLGAAYLQRVRETGDAGFYSRAQDVLASALALDPQNLDATVANATLALARHDFRDGERLALRARAIAPQALAWYPALVDARVELGRYDAAARTLQRFVDLKPTLASYARVSYFRELRGDLPGAVAAMRLAVSAGGDAPENVAYVQTLLGGLEFVRGRLGASGRAYRLALARLPGYVPAAAGLAGVEAARGDYNPAIGRLRRASARLPLPQYVIALGEIELAAGRQAQARRDLALVGAEEKLLAANGVNTDVELALFEANHGDADRAVAFGRKAWAQAPSVRSADALGWALTHGGHPGAGLRWADRALKLGSRDPNFLYHAGISALRAGRHALARRHLGRALALNPRFSALYAPRARRALSGLR